MRRLYAALLKGVRKLVDCLTACNKSTHNRLACWHRNRDLFFKQRELFRSLVSVKRFNGFLKLAQRVFVVSQEPFLMIDNVSANWHIRVTMKVQTAAKLKRAFAAAEFSTGAIGNPTTVAARPGLPFSKSYLINRRPNLRWQRLFMRKLLMDN